MKPRIVFLNTSINVPGGTILGAESIDVKERHKNVELELGPEGILVLDKGKNGDKEITVLIPMSNIKFIVFDGPRPKV